MGLVVTDRVVTSLVTADAGIVWREAHAIIDLDGVKALSKS